MVYTSHLKIRYRLASTSAIQRTCPVVSITSVQFEPYIAPVIDLCTTDDGRLAISIAKRLNRQMSRIET